MTKTEKRKCRRPKARTINENVSEVITNNDSFVPKTSFGHIVDRMHTGIDNLQDWRHEWAHQFDYTNRETERRALYAWVTKTDTKPFWTLAFLIKHLNARINWLTEQYGSLTGKTLNCGIRTYQDKRFDLPSSSRPPFRKSLPNTSSSLFLNHELNLSIWTYSSRPSKYFKDGIIAKAFLR